MKAFLRSKGLLVREIESHPLPLPPSPFYIGFDPTAPSLHVGHLIGLSTCHHLQKGGYKPIFLLGDATAPIGDPSGKIEKKFNSANGGASSDDDVIISSAIEIRNQIKKIIESTGNNFMEFVNNSFWHKERNLLDFIKGDAKRIQMAPLLSRSLIKDGEKDAFDNNNLTLSKFMYQILQGLDFEYLYREKGCLFQIGGSDQWGNMITGYDMIKRFNKDSSPYSFTFPLLSLKGGDKMGKSNGNAIFLSPKLTSPYECYQFFLGLGDEEALELWNLISFSFPYRTDLSAQQNIADTIITLLHGEEGLREAKECSLFLFNSSTMKMNPLDGGGGDGGDGGKVFQLLKKSLLKDSKKLVPKNCHLKLKEVLKEFVNSNDISKLIGDGAIRLNKNVVREEDYVLKENGSWLLSIGKRKNFLIEIKEEFHI